ncbi:MAG: hypothetical protein Q7S02_01295, partial [bacterium]|nr:hypothetical protein [bacterium]
MDMDRRKKIIITIAVVLVIIGVIMLLLRPKRTAETPQQPTAGSPAVGSSGTLSRAGGIVGSPLVEAEPAAPLPPPSAAVAARQLAMTFAERYGSFSSEGNFVNVEDLYTLMTERYQRRSEADVVRQRSAGPSAAFQSTTTIVVGAEVEISSGEDSKEATVRVATQRTAVRGGERPRTYGQELTVKLLKVGEEWKV